MAKVVCIHGIKQEYEAPEVLADKQALLAQLESWAPPAALLATNTSSLRLADVSARSGAKRNRSATGAT